MLEDQIISDAPSVVETSEPNWEDSIEVTRSTETQEPAEKLEESAEEKPVDQPKPKKQTGYLKKLGRAEAERDMERAQRQALEAKIAELEGKKPTDTLKPPVATNGEPDPSDPKYENNFLQYNRDLAKFEAQKFLTQELGKRDQKVEDQNFQATLQKQVETYSTKLEAYEAENPGTKAKIEAVEDFASDAVTLAVLQSPMAIDVAVYLADQPDTIRALSQMNPQQMQLAMARIEGIVHGTKDKGSAVRPTRAPAPITPTKPTGPAQGKAPWEGSQQDFEKWYLANKK